MSFVDAHVHVIPPGVDAAPPPSAVGEFFDVARILEQTTADRVLLSPWVKLLGTPGSTTRWPSWTLGARLGGLGRRAARCDDGAVRGRRDHGERAARRRLLGGRRGDGRAGLRASEHARVRGPRRALPVEHGRQPARDDGRRGAHGHGRRARAPSRSACAAGPRRRHRRVAARAAAARAPSTSPPRRGSTSRPRCGASTTTRSRTTRACCAASWTSWGREQVLAGSDHPFDMADPDPVGDRARVRHQPQRGGRRAGRQRGEVVSVNTQIVVAGAGHNSLITAAYLAIAGYSVVVLDSRPIPGGGAASEELLGPGYVIDSCSTGHTLIQTNPLLLDDELGLRGRYGLEYLQPDPFAHVAFPDGTHLTTWLDRSRTVEEIARFSSDDARAYERLLDEYDEVKHIFAAAQFTPGRVRSVARAAAGRAPARVDLAAAAGDERVGRDPARVLRRAHPGVPALAGLPDARAGRLRRVRAARVLARVRSPAALVDDPARRLGRADGCSGALHRGARRHGAVRAARGAAAGLRRALPGRRDRGRRVVHGQRGRRVHHPRQAPAGDGAGERVGRGLPLRRGDVRRGRVGDGGLHGGFGAARVRDAGRAALGGLGRARGLPARRHRVRARAARRPLRRGPGVGARGDAHARRSESRPGRPPHGQVPLGAVLRVPGAQGGAGRPPARAVAGSGAISTSTRGS